jgi:sec-independent protein translocase protein TatA
MHMPGGIGLILILVVVVLLFGTKKIPDLFKGVGEGLREFKKAQRDPEPDPKDQKKVEEKPEDQAKKS